METKDLIQALRNGVQRKFSNATGNEQPDLLGANTLMLEAGIVLQAIFDPENQPSQFGTTLTN